MLEFVVHFLTMMHDLKSVAVYHFIVGILCPIALFQPYCKHERSVPKIELKCTRDTSIFCWLLTDFKINPNAMQFYTHKKNLL